MTSIRPNTGLAPVFPQTMPLGPTPPVTQELDPTLNEDSSSISAQPQAASLADIVAKAKAAAETAPEASETTQAEPPQVAQTPPEEVAALTEKPEKPSIPAKPAQFRPLPPRPQSLQPQAKAPAKPTETIAAAPASSVDVEQQHKQIEAEKKAANDHPAKQTMDWVGYVDAGKEGAKFVANDLPDIVRTPPSVVSRLFNRLPALSNGLGRLASSRAATAVGRFLSSPAVKPVVKGLGRVAPFAAVAVTGVDIYRTVKDVQDPTASTAKKAVSVAKSVTSTIASAAGVAAVFLAPTGVGAAVAGGISLVAGLLTFGLDTAVDRMK